MKGQQHLIRGGIQMLIIAGILTALIVGVIQRVQAQGPELITNGTMDSYYGTGGSNVVPTGWALQSNLAIGSSKQQWQFENQSYGGSWKLSTRSAAFTMYGSQFIAGIKAGTPLRFSAFANIYTCNREDSCINNTGQKISQQESGARVRIGIDPTGGRDPAAASVVWSAFAKPFDAFSQIVVDAKTTTDAGVSVYLNYVQDSSMLLNDVFWDNASLVSLDGSAVINAGGVQITATPVPAFVRFVTPQGTVQADGTVIHVVKEGDTLASIALAYKTTIAEIRKLNNIPADGRYFLQIGQKLIVAKAEVKYLIVTATPTLDPSISPTVGAPTQTPQFIVITATPRPVGG